MKLFLEMDLDDIAVPDYQDVSAAIERSFRLYRDAVSIGEPPMVEDEGTIVNNEGETIGRWDIRADVPETQTIERKCPSCKGAGCKQCDNSGRVRVPVKVPTKG